MVERADNKRYSSPIVPDVEASLTAHRRHASAAHVRVWPLWMVVLLLLAILAALAYLGWQERQALQREIGRLEGQLSNVHARFDGLGENRAEDFEEIVTRVADLANTQQAIRERLEEQEGLIESVRTASVDEATFASLEERLATLDDELSTLEAVVSSVRVSLDSLERSGEDGRAALATRVDGLESLGERHEERWQRLAQEHERFDEALSELRNGQQALAERLDEAPSPEPDAFASLEEEVRGLAGTLENLTAQRDDDEEALASLGARLSSAQAELTELRQSQLATSAQLEALQSQLEN